MWIRQSFKVFSYNIPDEVQEGQVLCCTFVKVKDQLPLIISFNPAEEYSLIIKNDSMKDIGDIIQDFCDFSGIKDLQSIANFPHETEKITATLAEIEELSKNKAQISANLADNIQELKRTMVLGEDARMM